MRKLDWPLYWLYQKTNNSPIVSFKVLFASFAVLITVSMFAGEAIKQWWLSVPVGLLGASVPLLIGFIIIKLKFNWTLNRIPKAELAYFMQYGCSQKLEKGFRWFISTYISLLLYLWLLASILMILSIPVMVFLSVKHS